MDVVGGWWLVVITREWAGIAGNRVRWRGEVPHSGRALLGELGLALGRGRQIVGCKGRRRSCMKESHQPGT